MWNDDGSASARVKDCMDYGARNARLASTNLVSQHDTALRQPLGYPFERRTLPRV
jgi:hypothetical protein